MKLIKSIQKTSVSSSRKYFLLYLSISVCLLFSFLRRQLDLEEKRLVKLDNGKVFIPYFFVCSFYWRTRQQIISIWKDLLIGHNIRWQDWELFNWNYIVFRFSLYSFFEYMTVYYVYSSKEPKSTSPKIWRSNPVISRSILQGHLFLNAGNLTSTSNFSSLVFDKFLSIPESMSTGFGLILRFTSFRLELNYCIPLKSNLWDSVKPGFQIGIGMHFM